MRVFVNGRRVALEIDVVTYDSVARLAFPTMGVVPPGLAVTYRGVAGAKAAGILTQGQFVVAQDGAVFNVVATGGA